MGRSNSGILHSALDVKSWLARLPSADEVRPGRCPSCGVASRCPGAALMVWGHGLRERTVEGPLDPGEPPVAVVILGRRYVCQACEAVLVVVPRGVLAWRQYTAGAIASALALFGLDRLPRAEVRRRTSASQIPKTATDPGHWKALRRWGEAAARGALFTGVMPIATEPGNMPRQIAAKVAMALVARVNPSLRDLPLAAQAFHAGVAAM